jgi:hypothetical protein
MERSLLELVLGPVLVDGRKPSGIHSGPSRRPRRSVTGILLSDENVFLPAVLCKPLQIRAHHRGPKYNVWGALCKNRKDRRGDESHGDLFQKKKKEYFERSPTPRRIEAGRDARV